MKFYFDEHNGNSREITEEEALKHLSKYQLGEGKETKMADPLVEVSYMTVGGFIRFEI